MTLLAHWEETTRLQCPMLAGDADWNEHHG